MSRRNTEQQRMQFAFRVAGKANEKGANKKYEAYVQKIPSMIHTNGLGNTLAFIAGQEKEWQTIGKNICEWLNKTENPLKGKLPEKGSAMDLVNALKDKNFSDAKYRAVTNEVLALFNWLRRAAKACKLEKESSKKARK